MVSFLVICTRGLLICRTLPPNSFLSCIPCCSGGFPLPPVLFCFVQFFWWGIWGLLQERGIYKICTHSTCTCRNTSALMQIASAQGWTCSTHGRRTTSFLSALSRCCGIPSHRRGDRAPCFQKAGEMLAFQMCFQLLTFTGCFY